MAEEQGTTAQAEETAQDQESTEQAESQAEDTQQETTEEQAESQATTYDEDYVKGLRKEAAGYRTRLSAAEKRVKQLEEGQDAETSSTREENDNLKTENEKLKGQIRRAAFIESIGLPNPRAAWALSQDVGIEVEWDENHRPQKLDEVRKRLREEDPGLFGEGSADGGATTRTNGYQGAPGAGRLRHAYEQNAKG